MQINMTRNDINQKLVGRTRFRKVGDEECDAIESLCLLSWDEFMEGPRPCFQAQWLLPQCKGDILERFVFAMKQLIQSIRIEQQGNYRYQEYSQLVENLYKNLCDDEQSWNCLQELIPSLRIEMNRDDIDDINSAYVKSVLRSGNRRTKHDGIGD